jgi:hypothetical protein
MTKLDLSNHPALEKLDCYTNKLTSLTLSKHPVLKDLACFQNQLTSLDLSGCVALKYLSCSTNQLTSLDLSNNPALEEVDCFSNQLSAEALKDLYGSLQRNEAEYKAIKIFNNPGTKAFKKMSVDNNGWSIDFSEPGD